MAHCGAMGACGAGGCVSSALAPAAGLPVTADPVVDALNQDCFCLPLDRQLLEQALDVALGPPGNLAAQIAPDTVPIDRFS